MYSDDTYKKIASYIYKHSGIYYAEKDFYRLNSRITSILKELQLDSGADLLKVIEGPSVDLRAHKVLIDISTNNETYFFRDTKPFKVLTDVLIPAYKDMGINNYNIWSAGCSSGQEPYSIAISLLESGVDASRFVIKATDISDQILEKAKKGNFSNLDVQRGLPITLLMKYFDQEKDESWTVKPEIRKKVSFAHFNLLSDNYPMNQYDIVFCRNVLIYQDVKNRELILNNIAKTLKAHGNLFMGSGESLLGVKVPLKLNLINNAMLFKKDAA